MYHDPNVHRANIDLPAEVNSPFVQDNQNPDTDDQNEDPDPPTNNASVGDLQPQVVGDREYQTIRRCIIIRNVAVISSPRAGYESGRREIRAEWNDGSKTWEPDLKL